MIESYPLQWPIGRKRTPEYSRKVDPFQMPSGKIRNDLAKELRMMGSEDFIISSNLMVRRDGIPYANQKSPQDPGIALYFNRKGIDICISCDQYQTVDANLRAIGKTVEAIRGIERWGTEEMMDAAFQGFMALPEPNRIKPWHEILGISPNSNLEIIREAYQRLAHIHHPDKGGELTRFKEIKEAYEMAKFERG